MDAIILQENAIQVVHVGDLIASRYRVTKILPDSVDIVDEFLEPSPMAKPTRTRPEELSTAEVQPLSSPQRLFPAGSAKTGCCQLRKSPYARSQRGRTRCGGDSSAQAASEAAAKGDSSNRRVQTIGLNPNLLGYVQKVDGKIESVVADGDTVRLIPRAPEFATTELAGSSVPHEDRLPFGRSP